MDNVVLGTLKDTLLSEVCELRERLVGMEALIEAALSPMSDQEDDELEMMQDVCLVFGV